MLPRDHRFHARRSIALADCGGEPFVIVSRDTAAGTHDQVVEACRDAGFVPRVTQQGSQAHTVAAMVASGAGISLLPKSCAQLYGHDLIWRRLKGTPFRSRLALVWRTDYRSPALKHFLASTRRTLATQERLRPRAGNPKALGLR